MQIAFTRRIFFLKYLVIAVLLSAAMAGWGQSRMPANPSAWLVSAYHGPQATADQDYFGDYDKVTVIFFEVDDTVTQPLYFGVRDPGMDTADDPIIASPVYGDMNYRVYGGTGAYSNSNSRQLVFPDTRTALSGTKLDELAIPKGSTTSALYNDITAPATQTWVYSAAISPSQGEHIGNKYYFKYVVVGLKNPDTNAMPVAADVQWDTYFNRYQVAVSVVSNGDPVEISGVRAFSYSLCVSLEGTIGSGGPVWNLYPFVPVEPTPGAYNGNYIRPETFDGDYRTGNNKADVNGFAFTLEPWNWNGSTGGYSAASYINVSNDNLNTPGPGRTGMPGQQSPISNGVLVGSPPFTGKTWRFTMLGGSEFNFEPNGVDVWAAMDASNGDLGTTNTINVGGGTALRMYASEYLAPSPDHVITLPATQTILSGTTANLALQIVDTTGDSSPYVHNIRVEATGGTGPTITSTSVTSTRSASDKTLFTGADGMVKSA